MKLRDMSRASFNLEHCCWEASCLQVLTMRVTQERPPAINQRIPHTVFTKAYSSNWLLVQDTKKPTTQYTTLYGGALLLACWNSVTPSKLPCNEPSVFLMAACLSEVVNKYTIWLTKRADKRAIRLSQCGRIPHHHTFTLILLYIYIYYSCLLLGTIILLGFHVIRVRESNGSEPVAGNTFIVYWMYSRCADPRSVKRGMDSARTAREVSFWAYRVGQDPSDSKSHQLHVAIFRCWCFHLTYIL